MSEPINFTALFPEGIRARQILVQLEELEETFRHATVVPETPLSRSAARAFAEHLLLGQGMEFSHKHEDLIGARSFLALAHNHNARGYLVSESSGIEAPPDPGILRYRLLATWFLDWLDSLERSWLPECIEDDGYGFEP